MTPLEDAMRRHEATHERLIALATAHQGQTPPLWRQRDFALSGSGYSHPPRGEVAVIEQTCQGCGWWATGAAS